MKKVTEYITRTDIPGNEKGDVQFAIPRETVAQWYSEGEESNREGHAWYYTHKLLPTFGTKYDDSQPRYTDDSGPTIIREERETPERIAVQRHYLTGLLAFALEKNNFYIEHPCIESMCNDLHIFSNRDVFTTSEFSRSEWNEMGKKVERAKDIAFAMATIQLDNDTSFISPKMQEMIDEMMTNNIKSSAILRLTGLIVRDLLADKTDSVINPYFDNPSAIRKRFYNSALIEGMIICNFPELWIEGGSRFGKTHREIMQNIGNMAIDAQIWNGVEINRAKEVASSTIVDKVKKYDF